LLFVVLQYGVRVWPWLMVALAALVLVPAGGEVDALGASLGALVATDREMAYPALLLTLLPPGAIGLVIVSLLAAFMSTVDTHFNWGASYVVSDVALRLRPTLTPSQQVRIARVAVLAFSVAAVLVAFQIARIEQAWRWVAALGAALGVPTVLRWFWWRVTAEAELAGALTGLTTAAGLLWTGSFAYELQLVLISVLSTAAMLAVIWLAGPPDPATVERFVTRVRPLGFWPTPSTTRQTIFRRQLLRTAALVLAVLVWLRLGTWLLVG
jgi:Na+/proline symporter